MASESAKAYENKAIECIAVAETIESPKEKAAAIFALEAHDRALTSQLHAAEALLTKNGTQVDHILANKLARITADLDQRSVLGAMWDFG